MKTTIMKTVKTIAASDNDLNGKKMGVILSGYERSSSDKERFILNLDESGKHYFSFPRENVLVLEYIDKKERQVKVLLEEATQVEEGFTRILYSRNSPLEIPDDDSYIFSLMYGNLTMPSIKDVYSKWLGKYRRLFVFRSKDCEAKCIQKIREGKGLTAPFPGPGGTIMIVVTPMGKQQLLNCLRSNCGYRGTILRLAYAEAIAQLEGNVDPNGDPDIPPFPPVPPFPPFPPFPPHPYFWEGFPFF